jgi:hypothetical protein
MNHVKSFLGLLGYYRKFIWDYANKARPLTILTRQKEPWRWGPTEEEAFQFLKTCLLRDPILRFPNFDLEFIVQTDASGFAVGSVLAQRKLVNNQKEEYAVAYASQQLNETQEKWHTTDKEAYALYHALKTFYPYLYGKKFTVETDHKALEGFPKITENMSKKVIRWALFASEFDFKTVFRSGITNQNADTLSRIPKTEKDVVMSGQTQVIKALTTQAFAIEQKNNEFCKKVRNKYEKCMTSDQENENDSDDCAPTRVIELKNLRMVYSARPMGKYLCQKRKRYY